MTRTSLFNPEHPDLTDPALGLNRDDYRNMNDVSANQGGPKGDLASLKTTNVIEPPVPDIAEILAAPKPPKLGQTKLVSIAVTDDVPLKDVLIELSRLADVDIEVDSSISGGISFRAKDRPFNEVIDRISSLAGLRYTMKNNVLRVERDTPYVQIYSLDFLNMDRSSQGSVSISTNVLSGTGSSGSGSGGSGSGSGTGNTGTSNTGSSNSGSSGGGSGSGSSSGGAGGLNTGSSSSVTSTANSDFWKQFEESIKQILTYNESKRISSPVVAAPQAPVKNADGTTAAAAPVAAPTTPETPAKADKSTDGFYIMNRQGSTLTVSGTERQHALIREFINKIQKNVSSQVLIEAKIVEVKLNDEFQSGIDWTKLGGSKISFGSKFGAVTDPANVATINIGKPQQLAFTNNIDLSAAVQLAQTFGATRTLSSPRLHAINNQQSVLTFAENHVYFELSVQQNTNATTVGAVSTITVNSILHTVPIGIILTLQPSINSETNEVTLSVRPTLSRITSTVNDPAVAFLIAQAAAQNIPVNVTNAVPVIEVRELDSILKLKSGQVMVIGGLMQDVSDNTDSGLPGLSSVPLVGNLFKGVSKNNNMQELVIFIRATIVDSAGDAAPADKALYQKFTKDPRPLQF
jgi:MSHA type pilus biogenesis protein MshL